MAGEPASHSVWLKNRTRLAALLGLDLRPQEQVVAPVLNVNTTLPPEAFLLVDAEPDEEPGELEAGEAG